MSKHIVEDEIQCVHESKCAFNVGKDKCYIIGVYLKLGRNTCHCGTFLIRQGPVIEKYQVNSSNTVIQQESKSSEG